MSKTSSVFARVEPEIKEQAEQVLEQLGIPMSNAIGLFLNQVVLQRGIPFEIKLPFSNKIILDASVSIFPTLLIGTKPAAPPQLFVLPA